MLLKHFFQLNKVCFTGVTARQQYNLTRYSELSQSGLADISVMLNLHGLQINGGIAMSSPVVLVTGGLTGIGRATGPRLRA
jgi:hypothetical protein